MAAAETASDPDVEPPRLDFAGVRPEDHPLAGCFEDWNWMVAWTAKWLREQEARKRSSKRARRSSRKRSTSNEESSEIMERSREGAPLWRGRVHREARERRAMMREEARLRELWAKEEEEEDFDDAALLVAGFPLFAAGGFAGFSVIDEEAAVVEGVAPPLHQVLPLPFFSLGYGSDLDGPRIFSRTGSPASSGYRGTNHSRTMSGDSSATSTKGLSRSLTSSPGFGPNISPLDTWVTFAQLLSRRHDGSTALFGAMLAAAPKPPPEPPPVSGRPPSVPALIMRKLSMLSTDEQESVGDSSIGDDVWDDIEKRWRMTQGAEGEARHEISALLHEFVGAEEFRRHDAAASVQRRLLHELIQVSGEDHQDLDLDVWNEAERHAVSQILEGNSQSSTLAEVPAAAMQRLLSTRGYELPQPDTCQFLGRGSFGRVLKVRRTSDSRLFAVKRQFLGDFADDMVPVLREISILNMVKGAIGVVQIEDAFLMHPAKGAAEVWSVLEHFPHNLYKVRHRFRSEESARRVIFQVLLGLYSLHSADIVHRDLKPDNVLVDLGPSPPHTVRVALCDFNTSRSVHGFAAPQSTAASPSAPSVLPTTPDSPELPQLPLTRKITDRVTTSWWRAPEMWGWADTRQMTKRDLKSLDVFALGLVWAELLAVKSVLSYWEGVDPPKFRLLQILQNVDRPTDADLNELGFSDDVSCFIRCVLAGNMDALRPEMNSSKWPKNQEQREAFLQEPYLGIRGWIQANAWQCPKDSQTPELIASIARFSYRERPTVEALLANKVFGDLRAEAPSRAWAHRAERSREDEREAIREEQQRQRDAANRAEELRELRDDCDGDGNGAQNAFFERLAANAAADVEESVKSVCARVRTVIKETQRRGPRNRRRPSNGHLTLKI